MIENQEAYRKAKGRVEAKLGFYRHLGVYLGVNALLMMINLSTSAEHIWFKWPLMGWGIGVFFHGLAVFGYQGDKIAEMKKRMIEKEMKRQSRQDSQPPRSF